jgi:transposase InsO family protein
LSWGHTAFVIDAYAGVITGWECSLREDTEFVERALRNAAAFRAREGHPLDDAIHHSDAGSQYTAIHFTEVLMLAGLKPSVGTVGDALDNGLAETTIGLYKAECITRHRRRTRSGARAAVGSGSVVRGVRLARLTPRQPWARIIRSTVHRATGMPWR